MSASVGVNWLVNAACILVCNVARSCVEILCISCSLTVEKYRSSCPLVNAAVLTALTAVVQHSSLIAYVGIFPLAPVLTAWAVTVTAPKPGGLAAGIVADWSVM